VARRHRRRRGSSAGPALALADSAELPVDTLPSLVMIDVGVWSELLIARSSDLSRSSGCSALSWTATTHGVRRLRPNQQLIAAVW
jgi:hypothetical protein